MTIDLESHVLKVAHEGIDKWDVYRVKTVKEGPHKGNKRVSNHAYGLPIARSIQIVIQDRIDNEYSGDSLDLTSFMKKYYEISQGVLTKLKEIMEK